MTTMTTVDPDAESLEACALRLAQLLKAYPQPQDQDRGHDRDKIAFYNRMGEVLADPQVFDVLTHYLDLTTGRFLMLVHAEIMEQKGHSVLPRLREGTPAMQLIATALETGDFGLLVV